MRYALGAGLVIAGWFACAAQASIVGTTGTLTFTDTPHAPPSDTEAFVFDEQRGVPFVGTQGLNFGSITPGTLVDSHYLQFDTIAALGSIGTGSVTFDGPILGVITSTANLTADLLPDVAGTSDTYFGLEFSIGAYPSGANPASRGLGSPEDDLIVVLGSNTLTIDSLEIADANQVDGIRILTEHVPIPCDLNGDGYVGLDDLDIVLSDWNQTVPPADPRADVSGDGFIGLDDLDCVLIHWNEGTPPVTSVPEPTGVVWVVAGAGMLVRRRCNKLMSGAA